MKKNLLPLALLLVGTTAYSQVGIGTLTPNKSSQLDVVSTNKGILIPRVALENSVDATTITAGNINSLLVFNTNTKNDITPGYYYWFDNKWMRVMNDADVIALDKNTTNTSLTIVNGELVLTDSDGNIVSVPLSQINVLTTLAYNATNNELTYTGENGPPVVLNLNEGSATYNATTNVLTYTNEAGVQTPLNLNNTGLTYEPTTSILSYVNTLGLTQTVDLGAIVAANETLTTLAYNATNNELTYTGENGTPVVLNLNEGSVAYNATTNVLTYTNEAGVQTPLNLNNTGLTYEPTTSILSYVNTLGLTQTVDLGAIVAANETLTTLAYNATNNELTYTGENGTPVILNLNEGSVAYNATTNVLTYTNEAGVQTPLNLNNTGLTYEPTTSILSYVNTLGLVQTVDLGAIVAANETNTTLSIAAGALVYNNEQANNTNVNLISADANNALIAGTDGALFIPTAPATTNTLVNDGINTLTSTVNGVVANASVVNTNILTLDATNKLTSTINGVESNNIDLASVVLTPWNVESTPTRATLNTQNIYQMGNVAIGTDTAVPDTALDVRGAVRGGVPHPDELSGTSVVGVNSVALGSGNKASGEVSTAFGLETTASGNYSTAMGVATTASGMFSTAMGSGTTASGHYGLALGTTTTASNSHSTAMGFHTIASGSHSTAIGNYTIAPSRGETAIGSYNAITTGDPSVLNWIPTDALFQVGNGTGVSRSNAITVLKNSHTAIGVSGTEATAKPTELLDLGGEATTGNGGLKIRNINSPAYAGDVATDKVVVADADGVLKTVNQSTLVIEPWYNVLTNDKATSNTQNIYQMGRVGIFNNNPIAVLDIVDNGPNSNGIGLKQTLTEQDGYQSQFISGFENNVITNATNNNVGIIRGIKNNLTSNGTANSAHVIENTLQINNTRNSQFDNYAASSNNINVNSNLGLEYGFLKAGEFRVNLHSVETSSASGVHGVYSRVAASPDSGTLSIATTYDNVSSFRGQTVLGGIAAASVNTTNAYGIKQSLEILGNGVNVTGNAAALELNVDNGRTAASSVVNNLYGINIKRSELGGGANATINNAYGIYINRFRFNGNNANNAYNFYSAGADTKNYFQGRVGIGETAPTTPLHVKATTNPVRFEGLQTSTNATDKIVVADADGVLKTVASISAAPKFFYAPSIVLPTNPANLSSGVTYNAGTETFTVNLHGIYNDQFGMTGDIAGATRTAIKSPTASTLSVLPAASLEYFVTYFDNTVFDPTTITLSDAGIMTYKVLPSSTVTEKTYMNIVFKVK